MLRFRIKSNLELTLYTGIVLGSWGKVSNGSCCFTERGITNIRSHAYCAGCMEQKYQWYYHFYGYKVSCCWPLTLSNVTYFFQVCSTDVDEALMKEEFDKLSAALIQGATTCSPPMPLTTIVVQVMSSQNYDLCACFPSHVLCNLVCSV